MSLRFSILGGGSLCVSKTWCCCGSICTQAGLHPRLALMESSCSALGSVWEELGASKSRGCLMIVIPPGCTYQGRAWSGQQTKTVLMGAARFAFVCAVLPCVYPNWGFWFPDLTAWVLVLALFFTTWIGRKAVVGLVFPSLFLGGEEKFGESCEKSASKHRGCKGSWSLLKFQSQPAGLLSPSVRNSSSQVRHSQQR